MKIPLNVLLYALSPKAEYEAQNIDFAAEYLGIKMFDPCSLNEEQDPEFIYMVPENAFLDVERWKDLYYPGITLMCLKNEANLILDYFHMKQSLVILDPPRTFNYIVNRIINIYANIDNWYKSVQLALINERSMQEILDITKPYVPNPVIVLDRSFSLLGFIERNDRDIPVVKSILEKGYVIPEVMATLRKNGLMSFAGDEDNPKINFYSTNSGEKYYSMTYRFYQNENVVGYLIVFQCEVHPKTNFLYLMNMIVDSLSLYFRSSHYQNYATTEVYENILQEILTSDEPKRAILEDRLSYVSGLPLDGRFLLARLEYGQEDEIPLSFLCWDLKNSFQNVKPFVYQEKLYMLRVLPEEREQNTFFTLDEENLFRKAFRGYPFALGVSHMFFSLMDLKRAAWQCGETLSLQKDKNAQEILYFRDMTMKSFLSRDQIRELVYYYTSPDYEILRNYDQVHNTDFCDIYMKYLENGGNINQTASATFLHRNTVLNKVKKAMSIMPKGNDDYQRTINFATSYIYDHMHM